MLKPLTKKEIAAIGIQNYHKGYSSGIRCGAQQARCEQSASFRKVKKAQKVKRCKLTKKRVAAVRLEAFKHGRKAQRGKSSYRAMKRVEAAKAEAFQQGKKVQKATSSIGTKKLVVAARVDAYQKGYLLGVSRGSGQERDSIAKCEKEQRSKRSKASRKRIAAAKHEAYQEGVKAKRAKSSYAYRKRVEVAKLEAFQHGQDTQKTTSAKESNKAVVAARVDAYQKGYLYGIRRGVQQQRSQKNGGRSKPCQAVSKVGSKPCKAVCVRRRLRMKTKVAQIPAWASFVLAQVQVPPKPKSKLVRGAVDALRSCPTPLRTRWVDPWEAIDTPFGRPEEPPKKSRPTQNAADALYWRLKVRAADAVSSGTRHAPTAVVPVSSRSRQGAAAAGKVPSTPAPSGAAAVDALHDFLTDPTGVVRGPAAFQLRLKQICQVVGSEEVGQVLKKFVIVVGSRCSLWKLNQIIAECFDAGDDEFKYEPKKGKVVLGSHFAVARPLEPNRCNKVVMCSSQSAAHVGSASAFMNDRDYNISQLWRGKSTRNALIREPAEAAQQVVFASPLLSSEVHIGLDGIMLESYDNHRLFDKWRRHSNGCKPLPRIVRSSFLSVAEVEAKNIVMQGDREGSDYLHKIDVPWSAMHESCRRSQRKPLFRKDGRDYDMNDLCHVSEDEETDSDNELPVVSQNARTFDVD